MDSTRAQSGEQAEEVQHGDVLANKNKMKNFLYKIITGNEKLVLYDNSERKNKIVDWSLSTIDIDREIQYLRKKILLSIW